MLTLARPVQLVAVTLEETRIPSKPRLRPSPNVQVQDGRARAVVSPINDMDAQNAAEPVQSRPVGVTTQQRPGSDIDTKPKASASSVKVSPPFQDAKTRTVAAAGAATIIVRPEEATEDRDSDAETIVLPGKDGHSPSKVRKVRQEDKSESDGDAARRPDANRSGKSSHNVAESAAAHSGKRPGEGLKKKRLSISAGSSVDKDHRHRTKDAVSSGLSSAPTSPQHLPHSQILHANRRRRSDAAPSSPSESEHSHHKASTKASLREKLASSERPATHKRKAHRGESDDEADARKARRQRTTSAGVDAGRHKESRSGHVKHEHRHRSISPPSHQHRRSISTQMPSQGLTSNGPPAKKRRVPPPLQSTDYQSDDSSAGGSPHPRSITLRSLATPASADSNVSPAKMGPHKKHLDAHGQTLLARACARGEYEGAKQRLRERPEDLNVADYAGNTPLQIAAINGCEDIVKLLIDAGCNLDCVNYDKDTPLLDAVDNGHLNVVKLLLDAGVNPRKANVNGEEPIDRVTDETENADEIRTALLNARKRIGGRRRSSEEPQSHAENPDPRDSNAPDSPRQSPAASLPANSGRRSGTVRSTKTRNDLLYMPLDDKTLRQAAGRGDEDLVARILQVKEGMDDPESMVAAARGGHDLVIQLLLGLGGANADPGPVSSLQGEFATPILAAIGQENIKVVKLLLEQQGFDPTRRFKGETYYEIARRRQGTNWQEEEQLLKNAYDEYKRSHRDIHKAKGSGARREREKPPRRDDSTEGKVPKRHLSSPTREAELKRKSSKLESPREKRRSNSMTNKLDDDHHKRGHGRPRKDPAAISDQESSPALSTKTHKAKRAESDMAGMSSDGEAAKPRRKLVSKGELRGERDKQKRLSSAANKEPSSPHEPRFDESLEKARPTEKYHDRAKALKRDDTKERSSGDPPAKRHRLSLTPDRVNDGIDKDNAEAPPKRRRLDAESQDGRHRKTGHDESRPRKSNSAWDGPSRLGTATAHKEQEGSSKRVSESKSTGHHLTEKPIHVKSEEIDSPLIDVQFAKFADSRDPVRARLEEEMAQKKEPELIQARKNLEEEMRRADMEDYKRRKKKEEEEEEREQGRRAEEERKKRLQEEEARKRKELQDRERERREAAQREEEARQKLAEEEKKRKEEEARRKLLEEEKKRKEEEARQKQIEEEKKRKEEEARRRQIEEERKRKEEEERRKREQEERLRKEQAEREAAEEVRRQREEEERRERERRERIHREEMERKRAVREAELKRAREEQERARLEKLPPLLRWFDTCPEPKVGLIAEKFKYMLGFRYDTIRPQATSSPEGREQWLLNTHVALLLGEKDLRLSRCKCRMQLPKERAYRS